LHRAALPAATAAGMALAGPLQAADIQQRRAVGQRQAGRVVGFPALLIHREMHRRQAGEQGEDAADRAQVPTPHALAAHEQQADDHRAEGRAAENQQGRLGVVIHADQLAIEGGQAKAQRRPAAPAQPARNTEAAPVLAGPFAQGTFRAEHAAPQAPEQHHRQQHERPPEAPEDELREQRQVVHQARLAVRQRQQRRQHQQHGVDQHHRPLHGTDQAPMAAHAIAQALQPAHAACRERRRPLPTHSQ